MRKLYTFIFIFFVLLISAQDFNHGGKPVTEGVTVIKRVEKTDFKVQEGTERSTLAQRLPEDGTVPTEPDPIEFDPPMDSAEPTEPTDPVEGSGFDPTTIVNSTGVTKGDLSVSLTGGANYNVPIAVPPGINGTVPQLSLVYDSQSGNGLVGWGWNISGISTISRIPSTKFHDNSIDAVDFDSYDRFSFDGQRLMLKSGVYGSDGAIYETESYKNLRITSLGTSSYGSNYGPNYFVVEYPDGSKAYYGQNTNSKSKLTWAITYWENPLGVRISYEYTSSGNNLFISKVKYGSLTTNTAINEIQFIYTTRNRNEQAYVGGESFLTSKLLNQIKVMGNGEGFRNYYLSHNTTSLGYQRLYSITEKTGDNSMALNSTLFDYSTTDNSESFQISNPITLNVGDINSINSSTASGDFDGDGKSDFVIPQVEGTDSWSFFFSKGNEFQNVNTGIGFPYIESIVDYFPIYGEIYRCVQENTFISSDLNGDGKTDILLQSNYTGANTGDPYLINFRVFENKGFDGSSIIFEQNYINSQIGGIKRYPIPIFLDHNHINQNLEYAVISDNTIRTFKSTKDNKIDNQLNEITLGNGVKEIITYSALKEDSSSYNSVFAPSTYTENYPNFDVVVSPSFKVVSKIEMQSSTVYKKQDYKYYGAVSNVEGLGFLGFRGLTKTNWYNDDYPIISNISKYDIAKRGAVTESFSEMGISTANTSYTPTNFITKSVLNYEDELLPNKVYKIKNTSSEIFNGWNCKQKKDKIICIIKPPF